jgi:DNA primase
LQVSEFMDEFFIRELKTKVTLSDLISKYTKVVNKSGKYLALCPFHREKTPSFNINNERGVYHCFGCNAHGDAISFLQEHLSINFVDAIKELCMLTNTQIPILEPQSHETRKKLDIIQSSMEFMQKQLQVNSKALNYLKHRRITGSIIEQFCIGFGGTQKDGLFQFLKPNFTADEIQKSGVCIQSSYGSGMFDRFANRVIFPIHSHSGNVIAFSGRIFNNEENTAKYVNSPETEFFKKSQVLYNFHKARKTKEKFVIVCEGFMDVIAFYKDGIQNTVAQMGTAFTKEHLHTLVSRFEEIAFCLDSDSAGVLSQKRITELLFEMMTPEKSFSFIVPHGTKDPDEYLEMYGSGSLKNIIIKRIPLHEHTWELWSKNIDFQDPSQVTKFEQQIDIILKKNASITLQQHYRYFFRNKIYQAKFRNNTKVEVLTQQPQSFRFLPHEENTIAFVYQHYNTIHNQDILTELEIYFETEKAKNLFNLIIEGEDVSEEPLLEAILKENTIPKISTLEQIENYYKLLYYSSMLLLINKEIIQNKHDFQKMLFLSKERDNIQSAINKIRKVFS